MKHFLKKIHSILKRKILRIKKPQLSINYYSLIIASLILLLAGSGIIYINSQNQSPSQNNTTQVTEATPISSAGSAIPSYTGMWKTTAGYQSEKNKQEYQWKLYKNKALGFEFTYPEIFTSVVENDKEILFSYEPGLPAIKIAKNPEEFFEYSGPQCKKATVRDYKLYLYCIDSGVKTINFGGHKAQHFSIRFLKGEEGKLDIIQTLDAPRLEVQILSPLQNFREGYLDQTAQRAKIISSSFLFDDADKREGRPDRMEGIERKASSYEYENDPFPYETRVRFTSPALGVTFTFKFEHAPYTKRDGNKICWEYYSEKVKSDSRCVERAEVFSKQSSQSLKEAIEEQILKGYDQNICVVKSTPDEKDSSKEVARIFFSSDPVGVADGPYDDYDKCPHYMQAGGIRFFTADKNSDKFVFFSIGTQSYPRMAMDEFEFIK